MSEHRLHTRHCIPNLLVSSSRRLDTYMLQELVCALEQLIMNVAALWAAAGSAATQAMWMHTARRAMLVHSLQCHR